MPVLTLTDAELKLLHEAVLNWLDAEREEYETIHPEIKRLLNAIGIAPW